MNNTEFLNQEMTLDDLKTINGGWAWGYFELGKGGSMMRLML